LTELKTEREFKMAEEPLKLVAMRNRFYRDGQRKALVSLIVSMMINLVLGFLLVYVVTHPPAPQYFATSINGRITPLYPLNEPNQSDSAILQWANYAAIASFSYNFVNYREELQAASGFFTPAGWDSFLAALDRSNMLKGVVAKKLIVSAVATRAPVIIKKGVISGGPFAWRVQMPVLVTYQSSAVITQENYVVTMLITRVSTLNSPRGIGISQFIVGPASTGVS
jgi:intracellular multiplication protein IcmL